MYPSTILVIRTKIFQKIAVPPFEKKKAFPSYFSIINCQKNTLWSLERFPNHCFWTIFWIQLMTPGDKKVECTMLRRASGRFSKKKELNLAISYAFYVQSSTIYVFPQGQLWEKTALMLSMKDWCLQGGLRRPVSTNPSLKAWQTIRVFPLFSTTWFIAVRKKFLS